MLAKKNRLPARTSVSQLLLKFPANYFILKVGENKIKANRFAFTVSKTVDRKAVVRNKLKRQFRRFIEENYNKIKPGYDFLFKVKKEAKNKKAIEIYREIRRVLEKEGFISAETNLFIK